MKSYAVLYLWLSMVLISGYIPAQTPVNAVNTVTNISVPGGTSSAVVRSHSNSVNTVLPNTNYNVNYNNTGNINIVDFTISGKSYVRFENFDTVMLRRAANAWEPTGGNKQHIYVQGPMAVDNLTFNMPLPPAYPQVTGGAFMERVMKEGYINRGSDNIFNNDSVSDRTYNNIERVDFVYKPGIATIHLSLAGFLIAERGGNDPFKIAAVTGIDANGNPTSFGPIRSVATSAYGANIVNLSTMVMRKDPADNVLRPFSIVSLQQVRSLFVTFSFLGVNAMQTIYGYALMANDVTASTSAEILNYSNSTYFPRTTTTTNGGLDLSAAPGIFHTDLVLAGRYLTLTARNKNCQQLLEWNDFDSGEAKEYQVERSVDREHFEQISVVKSNSIVKNSYTDTHISGPAYYRVKVVLYSGEEYYSTIVFSNNNCSDATVSVYPNPVKDMLTLTMDDNMEIKQISIYSLAGREIAQWNVSANSRQVKLDMGHLPQGQYFIQVKNGSGSLKAYPVIKL